MAPGPVSATEELLETLNLRRLHADTWQTRAAAAEPDRRLFGGLILAQGLLAARHTVPTALAPAHIHGVFLRAGVQAVPVDYVVERVRDGGQVTVRSVRAAQDGREIARLDVVFRAPGDGGVDVAGPPATAGRTGPQDTEHHPSGFHRDPAGAAFEFREFACRRGAEAAPAVIDGPTRLAWARIRHAVPDDDGLHAALLAYLSDFGTAWGVGRVVPRRLAQISTVTHSLWLHRPLRLDQWNLIELRPASVIGWGGLVMGSIHGADGRHGATLAQEVATRPRSQ